METNGRVFGIDLGGSSVKSVVATPQGEVLAKKHVDHDPQTPRDWAAKIRDVFESWRAEYGEPLGVGLSAPGLASKNGRSIVHMPGRLGGLENFDFTDFLKTSKPAPVCNDAHAALLGEAWVGAARGYSHVIMLTLGTGVGGAAIVDGRMLFGSMGRAGHLGHSSLNPYGALDICNCPGSLERVIGNCTIAERTLGRYPNTHKLYEAHVAGDFMATDIWLTSIRGLAAGIASFINILDCEAVIIGGGIAHAGEHLFKPLHRFLDEFEWRPGGVQAKLIPAQLGEYAGAIGAAYNAVGERKI